MANSYVKPERLWLKAHPEYTEKWVQELIADDPSILGLGDLVLRDQERVQPRGGRLDMLLQDLETKRRYEVELQLGATDEAHIIRTIEYWDIERKRYPQYDHCAVLVAEDITSRFLNVISLFNGTIPFVAIQMQAPLTPSRRYRRARAGFRSRSGSRCTTRRAACGRSAGAPTTWRRSAR